MDLEFVISQMRLVERSVGVSLKIKETEDGMWEKVQN